MWVAQLNMGDNSDRVSDSTLYEQITIERKSGVGWHKGITVALLDDADGNTYVMKGFELGLNPQYTYEDFITQNGKNFTMLPADWSFRVRTLEQDLIEKPEGGVATLVPDGFF